MAKDLLTRTKEGIEKRINANKNVAERDKKRISEFERWLEAKDSDPKTIEKHLYCMERFVNLFDKKMGFEEITREEMEEIIARLNKSDYAAWTKEMVKTTIKVFYKHFFGEDYFYPKNVAWIHGSRPKNKLNSTDILTPEEVQSMMDNAPYAVSSARDKAIIAVMYDGGLRIGELMSIRLRDIDYQGRSIDVDGKTGKRQVMLTDFSIPYLKQYININPQLKPNDRIWITHDNKPMEYAAISMMIKRAAQKAQVGKKVWNHLLRHSRATFYVRNKMQPVALKKQFGWSSSSTIPDSVYTHLDNGDVRHGVDEANGIVEPPKIRKAPFQVKKCVSCGKDSSTDARFCVYCGTAFDVEAQIHTDNMKELAIEMAKNPELNKEFVENIVHGYLMQERQRKKGRGSVNGVDVQT